MASLIPGGRCEPTRSDTDGGADRGQLLLTGAIVIAILLVALSMLLNSAIFAENVGARGTTDDVGQTTLTHRADLASVTNETIQHVNRQHNESHVALQQNFTRTIATWGDLSARHEAVSGATIEVSVRDTTNRTRVSQPAARNMTDAGGDEDWRLVNGTTGVNRFAITVEEDSLVELDDSEAETASDLVNESAFRAKFSSGTDRRVFLYYNETKDEVAVAVESSLGTLDETCHAPASSGTVEVNLTAATVGGDSCGALGFVSSINTSTRLLYEAGGNANGTYSLVVDGSLSLVDETNYNDIEASEGPYATGRIHAATVRLAYVRSTVLYRTEIAVIGGEQNG